MSKQSVKEFESWANKELAKWQKVLLMHDFSLNPIEPSKTDASQAMCRYPYKEINIKYSNDLFVEWKKNNKKYVTGVLVHELAHSITDPLYCKALQRLVSKEEIEDERERLTDHITNVVLRTSGL
jgi:hypothetical protein